MSKEKPLFNFQFKKSGSRRGWKQIVNKSTFNANLIQLRTPTPKDNIGEEITSALVRSIDEQIKLDPSLAPHHMLHFNMQAEGYQHAFQSTSFTLAEFEEGSERMDTNMQLLADKLNSGEQFGKNKNFKVELTFIRTPSKGSGHRNKLKPGRIAIETLLSHKRSVITINNKDELCCAQAIMTMKAWCSNYDRVEGYRHYENMKRGLPIQKQ